MKKWFSILILALFFPILTACEVSNTELANSLEGNMTRLVYSIGYLDSISTEELSGLVNNSSYFTHSSLFTGAPVALSETEELTTAPAEENLTDSTLTTNATTNKNLVSGKTGLNSSGYRTRTYNSPLEPANTTTPNSTLSNLSASNIGGYNSGIVDLSLLETNAEDLNQILLEISTKRGIIMLYCTDLRSGRATLSVENKNAISEYDDIIKETTNYLNTNTGALTNHFNGISSISGNENSAELINAKLIRANEVLKTRYAKLDTCLDAMDAIINILVSSIGNNYTELYASSIESLNGNNAINSNESNSISLNPQTNQTLENFVTNNNQTPIDTPLTNENIDSNVNNCNNCTTTTKSSTTVQNSTQPNIVIPQTQDNANNYGLQTLPLTEKDYDNTIVNFNYDGNNSSSINNNPQTPSASINSQNATTGTTENTINNTHQNETATTDFATTYPLRNPTVVEDEISKTEIALRGGLTKHQNNEKISAENVDSFVAKCNASPENLRPIDMARPYIKKDIKDIKEPPINLFDEEFVESEKELTPDLLPFAGTETEPSTLELKPEANPSLTRPLASAPELGFISLPFQYQEDSVIKKIPRTN